MTSQLDQLKNISIVVADTADFKLLEQFKPQDATTNPSLVLQGSKNEQYAPLIDAAIAYGKEKANTPEEALEIAMDRLTVNFGVEILKIIPGRVSTEVDAKLSFDTEASVRKAKRLVAMYEELGIGKDRLYIKLASTWQGIQAAKQLEAEGIRCNLTLLFSFAQAVACAQVGVSLISPFVGRILDWHKKASGKEFVGAEDPGVVSVTAIYNYYKTYGYQTTVMAASFRNTGEIVELAGCDKITISPALLGELAKSTNELPLKLSEENAKASAVGPKLPDLTEADFLFMHNEDAMAGEKLAEGIRNFNKDARTLETMLKQRMA